MSRKWIPCLILLATVGAVSAHAGGVEITPFGGYGLGGDFEGPAGEYELDESSTYGLILDFPVGRDLQFEIFGSLQGTDLVTKGLASGQVAEVDVNYLHIGILQHFNHGNVEPYYVFSGGLTQLDPSGFNAQDLPSVGFGGGVKLFLSRDAILGFRFGGRIMATYFDDPDAFCNSGGCLATASDTFMLQFLGEIGLVIRF